MCFYKNFTDLFLFGINNFWDGPKGCCWEELFSKKGKIYENLILICVIYRTHLLIFTGPHTSELSCGKPIKHSSYSLSAIESLCLSVRKLSFQHHR